MKTVPVFDTYLKHLNPRIIMGRFCLTVFGIYHWKEREKGIPIYIYVYLLDLLVIELNII